MEVDARPAAAADLPRLAELLALAVAELRPMRGGEVWAKREARGDRDAGALERWLGHDDRVAFAGCIDGVVMGMATARVEPLREGGRLAVVEELYVEPGAREVGIGEAMMDLVIEWAEARGCGGIDALTLPGNRETKNFFESFGLTARAIVVHRSLGGP